MPDDLFSPLTDDELDWLPGKAFSAGGDFSLIESIVNISAVAVVQTQRDQEAQ